MPPDVRTDRLLLREFRDEDRSSYQALFNDPDVIRYTISRAGLARA